MDPATLTLALACLQAALKETPVLVDDIRQLFAKGDPTAAQWEALRARVMANDYKTLVPNSRLTE
jgi:hypothetical protein